MSYSLIDDDHIDDQETINVGNLIIDLESTLEMEKIENEQQANNNIDTVNNNNSQQSCTISTTTMPNITNNNNSKSKAPDSTSPNTTMETNKSSTSSTNSNNKSSSISGKSHQRSSTDKHSNNSTTNNNHHNAVNSTNNKDIDSPSNCNKSLYKSGGEIKMRITKTGRSEHKIVSSPNQKSPLNGSAGTPAVPISIANNIYNNNTNNHHHHHPQHHKINCEDSSTDSTTQQQQPSSSISSTKECGTSTSIGTITEPECLGPCEPGTSVTLEGIVWQETEGGILVVNVTWRGKTYVGALLDCTKHDWAPPRLCDSPASDIDSKTHKGVRTKRIVTRSNGTGVDEKNLLQTTGKLRNGKGRRILTSNDPASCNKRQRESDKSNENIAAQAAEARGSPGNVLSITNSDTACVPMSVDIAPSSNNELIPTTDSLVSKTGPNSPMLIGCSEPNCSKKYRNMNGLLYHQAHAHGNNNDNSANAKDKVESPSDSADSMEHEEKHQSDVCENQEARFELENRQESSKPLQHHQQNTDQQPQEKQIRKSAPSSDTIPKSSFNETKPSIAQPMEQSPSIMSKYNSESEKRSITSSSHDHINNSHVKMKSPSMDNCNTNVTNKQKHHAPMNNNPPLPGAPLEEGMKPSGTTTGPPPAPHQANCFFNPPFLPGTQFNPFGMNPYFSGQQPPITPSMFAGQPSANNTLFKLMNSMRVAPMSESPSRLLSPVPKNLPFPPYKLDSGPPSVGGPPPPPHLNVPTSTQMTNPSIPPMPPMMSPHLSAGSPHSRMPVPIDPGLPHNLQPPTSTLPFNPQLMGGPSSGNPMNRQVMPNLDDALSKQFPRRY